MRSRPRLTAVDGKTSTTTNEDEPEVEYGKIYNKKEI